VSEAWLDRTDRTFLLGVARRAIGAWLRGDPLPFEEAPARLSEPRGVFVSLHRTATGELRGCIGSTRPHPLVEAVARAAVAAATMDDRFGPVRLDELDALSLTLSVLEAPFPVRPQELETGRHGVILRCGEASGLLLPQVASENGWARDTLLEMVCRKAGLPEGSWRREDAELLAFTATVFGEDGRPARNRTHGERSSAGPGMDGGAGRWHARVADVLGRLPGPGGERFAEALRHGTMSVEIYAPRLEDPQQPHEQDELYFVVQGRGLFVRGTERVRFGPGDVLFVAAGEVHRFEEFGHDLVVWVVFWGPRGGEK
jgi:AmmeMemoRadiSam system protein A